MREDQTSSVSGASRLLLMGDMLRLVSRGGRFAGRVMSGGGRTCRPPHDPSSRSCSSVSIDSSRSALHGSGMFDDSGGEGRSCTIDAGESGPCEEDVEYDQLWTGCGGREGVRSSVSSSGYTCEMARNSRCSCSLCLSLRSNSSSRLSSS